MSEEDVLRDTSKEADAVTEAELLWELLFTSAESLIVEVGESERVEDCEVDSVDVTVSDVDGYSLDLDWLDVHDTIFVMDASGLEVLDAVLDAISFEMDIVVLKDGDTVIVEEGD